MRKISTTWVNLGVLAASLVARWSAAQATFYQVPSGDITNERDVFAPARR